VPPAGPESTAARVALWRALHVLCDPAPHVIEDEIGLQLLAPDEGWRDRPDMELDHTRPFRASIVGRARLVEDLVEDAVGRGIGQYDLLGAGQDSFAQRRPDLGATLKVFEIDQPGPQAWKRERLIETGFGIPDWLKLVPVDFEGADSWWDCLVASGFDPARPAIVVATGLSMYLTHDAIRAMLRQVAAFAPGSAFAMTFLLPLDLSAHAVGPGIKAAEEGARASGTPFISFFTPDEMLALGREAGFRDVRHISAATLAERYFAGRTDGLRPPENAEEFLVAST
jgi:methyltransferase (TIGR00027 family)